MILILLFQEAETYRDYIAEKIKRHSETVVELDMLNLLEKQQKLLDPHNIDKHNVHDLESVLAPVTPRSSAEALRAERFQKLQISYVINESGERVYDYSSLPVDKSAYTPTVYVKVSNPNEVIEYR